MNSLRPWRKVLLQVALCVLVIAGVLASTNGSLPLASSQAHAANRPVHPPVRPAHRVSWTRPAYYTSLHPRHVPLARPVKKAPVRPPAKDNDDNRPVQHTALSGSTQTGGSGAITFSFF